jgi:hypothetical protein
MNDDGSSDNEEDLDALKSSAAALERSRIVAGDGIPDSLKSQGFVDPKDLSTHSLSTDS